MKHPVSSARRSTVATKLHDLYVFKQPDEVSDFLQRHPFLLPLVNQAYDEIHQRFPSSPVTLEVVVDPEDDEDVQLVATVLTSYSPLEVFTKLQELDAEWWLGVMDQAQGKFHITTRYQ
jgi:hypothetical protein